MVWADAGCACADADTAIGFSPLPCGALVLGGPPTIIVGRKLAQAESAASEMLSAELACRAFRIPNDIQARALPTPAVACRNPDFQRRREDPMSRVYNVIDADGHILEPLDLWDNYMDP